MLFNCLPGMRAHWRHRRGGRAPRQLRLGVELQAGAPRVGRARDHSRCVDLHAVARSRVVVVVHVVANLVGVVEDQVPDACKWRRPGRPPGGRHWGHHWRVEGDLLGRRVVGLHMVRWVTIQKDYKIAQKLAQKWPKSQIEKDTCTNCL